MLGRRPRPCVGAVVSALIVLTAPFFLVPGFIIAARYHQKADRLTILFTTLPLFPLLLWTLHALAVLGPPLFSFKSANLALGPAGVLVLALLPLLHLLGVLAIARTRHSPQTVRRRQILTAIRRYFAAELKREKPRLQDAWFPYLVAFGLDNEVDHWFKGHGSTGSTAMSSSTSSLGSGSSSWTGGGGSFGGAGASATWVAAASSMAAGVSSSSSSGSGGSSGGGGGGGW